MLYLLFAAPLIDPEAQSVDPYPPLLSTPPRPFCQACTEVTVYCQLLTLTNHSWGKTEEPLKRTSMFTQYTETDMCAIFQSAVYSVYCHCSTISTRKGPRKIGTYLLLISYLLTTFSSWSVDMSCTEANALRNLCHVTKYWIHIAFICKLISMYFFSYVIVFIPLSWYNLVLWFIHSFIPSYILL